MNNSGDFYNNLFIISSKSVLISLMALVIIGITQQKYLNKPLKIIFAYKSLSLLFTIFLHGFVWFATRYYEKIKHLLDYFNIKNTNFLEILFYINDFIFLGWFYYLLLGKQPYGKWIRLISIGLLIATIVNYLFIEGHTVFGVFNPTADAIFVFSIAAFYLWYLYRSHLMLPLQKNPYFWISFGLIVPHVIGFFLFLVGDITYEEDFKLFVIMSIIKNCFLILAQVLFAIGFWRARYAQYLPLPGEEEGSASTENV